VELYLCSPIYVYGVQKDNLTFTYFVQIVFSLSLSLSISFAPLFPLFLLLLLSFYFVYFILLTLSQLPYL